MKAGRLIRTYSMHPHKTELQRVVDGSDFQTAQQAIDKGIQLSLIDLYDLCTRAHQPAIKQYLLEKIKTYLKLCIEQNPQYGISDFLKLFLELSTQLSALERPMLDIDFLKMLTQLKQEIQALPFVQNSDSLKEMAENLPCEHQPATLKMLMARSIALKVLREQRNIDVQISSYPDDLQAVIKSEYQLLRSKM